MRSPSLLALARRFVVPPVSIVATVSVLVAAPAEADLGVAATTCLGKPVTVVATTTVTVGTEGDDVVAMTPLGWSQFDALGGDDTICLALGSPRGGRDPMPPTGWVDAGPGNDAVVDESALHAGAGMTVALGTGDDSFTGNALDERVFAESSALSVDGPVPSGSQRDVINAGGGSDTVWTAAPVGGLNGDRITFGAGTGSAVYRGAMSPEGLLDFSAATSAHLELPQPGAAEPVARGELVVDNVARRATVAGAQVLAWSGEIQSFRFGHDAATSSRLPVSFSGSSLSEFVTVAGGPVGDIRLAGGDDGLKVESYNDPFVPRSADGGAGDDSAAIDTACLVLTIVVDDSTTCDGTTGPLTSFAGVVGSSDRGGSRVTVVGTQRGERLVADGDRVTVRGRGGADEILVDEGWTTRVFGGAAADRIVATGDDVLVRGGAGGDRVLLMGSPGYFLAGGSPVETKRQIVLGGTGPDVLTGTTQPQPDRLVGGPGRDRANGRAGSRDYCRAEVTRRCERP